MEKTEYEQLCARDGQIETDRHLIQTKLANLKTSDPAVLDYTATKTKLQKELNALLGERGIIRAKLEEAKPSLDIQDCHDKAKSIPKILFSVALDQQLKTLDDDLSFDHQFQPCKHTVKLTIFDLIPASQRAPWNLLIDQLAVFENGRIQCPKCITEKNGLRAKLRDQINALRARMPDAEIADQEPRHTVCTARFNVHIKK